MQKLLILSDTHCGHVSGLTPPGWGRDSPGQARARELREQAYGKYLELAVANGPYDWVVGNGDMVDGKGRHTGGIEQIAADPAEQADMAEVVMRAAAGSSTRFLLTFGSPYHVRSVDGLEVERILAHRLCAEIHDRALLRAEDVTIDLRHFVGTSSIPHGRTTPLSREALWGWLHEARAERPHVDLYVRSHTHYHAFCGERDWCALTTPALQTRGSRFGDSRCSGTVDWGFVVIEVDGDKCGWEAVTARLDDRIPEVA